MIRKICLLTLLTAGLNWNFSSLSASDCGTFSIASLPWSSAEIFAEIDKTIISHGFGCSVELIAGDTLGTLNSMIEKGEPQLMPELWVESVDNTLEAAIKNQRLAFVSKPLSDGGIEGWWVPSYVVEKNPEIKSIDDALARPDLFPAPDNAEMGAVYNCPSSWDCSVVNNNLFNALDAGKKGFVLVDPQSAAGIDGSIAHAYESEIGWLGYYWAPSAVLGHYPMIRLEMGEHDEAEWQACTVVDTCENPKPNAWPENQVYSVTAGELSTWNSDIVDYLTARRLDSKTINELLAWMLNEQATGEEVSRYFFTEYEAVWGAWVNTAMQAKIKNAL